jgi:2-desacetyl-2-hydroxyethyl bacteriochlorophyllide A dehydrogenase
MLTGVFQSFGVFGLEDRPMPALQHDDDVLLQVRACGICGTDIHILAVPSPIPVSPGRIMGHEYTATIIRVGAGVTHLQAGDCVVVDPSITCGVCEYCRRGLLNCCLNIATLGVTRDGGLAEFSVAPAGALHKIRADVPEHLAALAEPLACVIHGAEKVNVQPGETVLILGAGPIGLMFAQFFRAAGAAKILISEISEPRARLAQDCGADLVIDPQTQDVLEIVKGESRIGVDVVVDAVGALFDLAVQTVRRGGRILLFGFNPAASPRIPQSVITRGEISVYGSYIAKNSFPRAIQLIEAGKLPLEKLVTHRFPLNEAVSAIETMRRGEGIKILVTP